MSTPVTTPLQPFAGLPTSVGSGTLAGPKPKVVFPQNEDGGTDCPPFWEDNGDGTCSPIDSGSGGVICPPGFVDSGFGTCVAIPIIPVPVPITGGGGTFTGGGGNEEPITINVKVDNAESIGQDALQSVASAVNTGVKSAVDGVAEIVKSTIGNVVDAIKTGATTLFNAVTGALRGIADAIADIVSKIASNLGSILSTIASSISDAFTKIASFIGDLFNKIGGILDTVSQQVQRINDTLIQPIATFINTTVKTIADLTVAIQKDLHDGLAGIVNIPGQIAGGLTSIDASLNRTIQQLGITNQAVAQSTIDYESSHLPGPYSTAYKTAFGGATDPSKIKTTFGATVNLSSESLQQVSKEAISALGVLLKEVLDLVWSTGRDSIDKVHADFSSVESVFIGLLDGILGIVTTLTAMGALVEPLIEAASEEARAKVPVTKLSPSTVIEALRRGFITAEQASAELAKLGYDATRIQVMRDIDVFLADPATALEWEARDIISEADLDANLKDHGMTDDDIKAVKEAHLRVPSEDQFMRWLNFGFLQTSDAVALLRKLRYDEESIQTFLATYQTRESASARAAINGRLESTGRGWLNNTMLTQTPDDVLLAGNRQGLHPDATRLLWQAHWNTPSYTAIIQSYFRGLRTLTEVQLAMQSENIPQELWDELIQINRPLIPFRSLAGYIKQGVLTPSQAQDILAQHGFDLHSQNILMAVFQKQLSSTQSTAAANAHSLSVGNARTLFLDGALTLEQYEAILEQHGFTPDLAKAQAQVDELNALARDRKQTLADMTAQVQAGVVTIDDAISELTKDGFTTKEISVWQIKIQRALKVNVRHPSLSELDKFLKAQLITLEQYKNELTAQGWNEPWLSAFLGLVSANGVAAVPGQ